MWHPGLGTMHPGAMLLVGLLILVPVWRICAKAGYSGWIGLLVLVPLANLLLLYFLGFSEWPLERRAAAPPAGPPAA
jgi:hypothetical protein